MTSGLAWGLVTMGLNDNEEKILAEIERQFYEEDPELARAVKNIEKPSRVGVRLALLGVIVGLAVVIGFFTSNTIVAFVGFALLVGSATSLVTGLRARGAHSTPPDASDEQSDSGGRSSQGRD